LLSNEDDYHQTKPNKTAPNFRILPRIRSSAHCKAKRRQTIEQIRMKAPRRSISKIFCVVVRFVDFRFGGLKNIATVAMAIAPKGKLI